MESFELQPSRVEVQIRFSDTDMLGHINGVSYAGFTEVGRADFFTKIPGHKPWGMLVHLSMDFKRESKFGQCIEVETVPVKMGRTSMTLRQNILADGEVSVTCTSVVVWIDEETRKPTPGPAHWRLPSEASRFSVKP